MQISSVRARAVAALALFFEPLASADVTRVEITTRADVQDGDKLVADRYLLPEDMAAVLDRAGRHFDLLTGAH